MNANGCVCFNLSLPLMSSELIDEKKKQFYYFILVADSVNLLFVGI